MRNPFSIFSRVSKLELKVADLATDLTALTTAVTNVTTDVASVLTLLKAAPNISPDQFATLETQIAALVSVDATLKAAIPTPAPTPAPAPTPTPTPASAS